MQANFGAGDVFLIPPATATDQTIVRIATLQEVQLDFSTTIKELMGAFQFAEESANAEAKLTGKAKFGKVDGRLLSAAMPGSTVTAGSKIKVQETGTVAAGAVTVTGSAAFAEDFGVYAADGTPYSKIIPASFTGAIATTTLTVSAITVGFLGVGQIIAGSGITAGTTILSQLTGTTGGVGTYSISVSQTVSSEAMTTTAGLLQYSGPTAGVYAFATGSNGLVLNFRYSKTQTGGKTVVLNNQQMGLTTKYVVELFNTSANNNVKTLGAKLFAAVFPKINLPFKNTDFTIPELDFTCHDNGSLAVAEFYIND